MPEFSGEVLAAISNEMVRLKASLYGKGPLQAKTYQCDDLLVSVLKGPMTKAERLVADGGRKDLVREFRLAFQDAAGAEFRGAVERLTGCRVLTYDSQVLFDPDVVVEMFVVDEGE